jgi:hypothetical protein
VIEGRVKCGKGVVIKGELKVAKGEILNMKDGSVHGSPGQF